MDVKDLVSLGSYGLVGVMLALIFLAAGAIWLLYKLTSNHMHDFSEYLEKNTEAMVALRGVIHDLKSVILNKKNT